MRSKLRPHLTYANVMATIAVFLALGGSAVAVGKLSGKKLKNRSVAAKKIRKNTLTGVEINEAKLGKVPQATAADRAASADKASNSDKLQSKTAAQLTDSCPTGTVDVGSACYEASVRSQGTALNASKTCTQAGGYLASASDLYGALATGKIPPAPASQQEWSSSWTYNPGASGIVVDSNGTQGTLALTNTQPYRCAFALREH